MPGTRINARDVYLKLGPVDPAFILNPAFIWSPAFNQENTALASTSLTSMG